MYDVLYDLNDVWGSLDTNTKDYIALTQAGSNQTQNFLALMSNFETAMSATATAMESTGSAMEENARYMESLEARTNQLRATFQDLAINVIENELVKALLDLANNALKVMNNEVGQSIIQFGLLTGVLTGGLTIWGTVAKNLFGMTRMFGVITTASTGLAASMGTLASAALPVAGILSLVAVGGWKIYEAWKEANPTVGEAEEKLIDLNTQLEINEGRLEEINDLPWYDRTPEILNEYEALKKENEELEKAIDKLEEYNRLRKPTPTVSRDISGARVAGDVTAEGAHILERIATGSIQSYQDLAQALNMVGASAEEVNARLAEMGIVFEETQPIEELADKLGYYNVVAERNLFLSKEQNDTIATLLNDNKELVETYVAQKQAGVILTDEQERLVENYYALSEALSEAQERGRYYSERIILTEEQVGKLVQAYPELSSVIENNNGVLSVATSSLFGLSEQTFDTTKAMVELIAQMTIFNNQDLDVKDKVAKLAELAKGLGASSTLLSILTSVAKGDKAGLAYLDKYGGLEGIFSYVLGEIQKPTESPGGAIESTKTLIDLLKEELELLDHQAFLMEKNGEDQMKMVEIYRQAQNKIHALAEEYRAKGYAETSAEIRELQQLWWGYEDDIQGVYDSVAEASAKAAEEAEKAWQESMEAQISALEKQREEFEIAFDYIVQQIEKEIELLEEQKATEEAYWDEKIQALQDQNAEIEKQIELEQAQEKLAQAKSKRVLIFKDGRFQYSQDVGEISAAQSELSALERESALQQEVQNLETLKNQAVQSINEQIAYWEKYKDEWSSVVENYQNEQNRLIAEQVLGIQLEGDNWKLRLDNLSGYVTQYKSILSQLTQAQATLNAGYQGNTAVGGHGLGGGGFTASNSNAYATVPGVGDVPVQIVDGKTVTSGLPVGTVVHTKGGSYKITGGDATTGGYQSEIVSSYASGTLGASGGLSLVGERGPELRVLNPGDGVLPSEITRNLMAWGSTNPLGVLSKLSENNIFNIDRLVLPNATDANGLVSGLKQMAYQRAYKRA